MTSPLRKKRQTTLRLEASRISLRPEGSRFSRLACRWTSALAVLAAAAGPALADAPSAFRRLPAVSERAAQVRHADYDGASDAGGVIPVQAAQAPERIQLKQGSGIPSGDDNDYYFKVESKPPTRERLFNLRSENVVLDGIEGEFRKQDPNQVFLIPAPQDRFDGPNNPNLGPLWFQNRKSGGDDLGEMKVENQVGVFPTGSKPEAAITNESIASDDVVMSIDVDLGNPRNVFGLVFRAQDPNTWVEDVDQIASNSFYFAAVSGDAVVIGKYIEGVRTDLASARIEPKMKFTLSVTAFGEDVSVARDGEEILRIGGATLRGTFAGIIGLVSEGKPVIFRNFNAGRFGGPFQTRAFAPSASIFKGANVHYWPLYFEQITVERWGQNWGNIWQPFLCQTTFYIDLFMGPYSFAKSPPWVCHSGECLPKPGDIVLPYRIMPPYPDKRGIIVQTSIMALWFALLPPTY